MKAIETKATVGKNGIIQISAPKELIGKKIKIIILIPENNYIGNDEWLVVNSKNPAFDFLREPEEDIYSLNDGKIIEHEK